MYKKFIEPGIFKNCLDIKETQEGIIPLRFTENQLKEYAQNENFRIRSYCPAGICIDVNTDTRYIRINYLVNNFCREWIFFDVFLNDVLVASESLNTKKNEGGDFFYNVPNDNGKLNRLTVYLPYNVELVIKSIEFSPGAIIEESAFSDKNLLCLGDSITQGMEATSPSSTYAVLLSRFYNMNLLNQGVGGYCFNKKSLDLNLNFKPDVITIAYGTNDWNKANSYSDFYESCSKYIEEVVNTFSEAKMFVVTPLWRSDLNDIKNAGTFFDIIEGINSICGKYPQINLIDGMELIPHTPNYFGDKNLHPSNEGFLHMAMNIIKNTKDYV